MMRFEFEVIADNAKIDVCACADAFDAHGRGAVVECEVELLLVDCCGSQQGGFEAVSVPFRHGWAVIGNILNGSGMMRNAFEGTVSERNDDDQALVFIDGGFRLSVCQSDPAGVETDFLRLEYELFAIVAALFFGFLAFGADDGNVIVDVGEFAIVGKCGIEAVRFVIADLNMETGFFVD